MPLYMVHLDSGEESLPVFSQRNGKINLILNTIKVEYVLINIFQLIIRILVIINIHIDKCRV